MTASLRRAACLAALALAAPLGASGAVDGIHGTGAPGSPQFSLTARLGRLAIADGASVPIWGYADDAGSNGGRAQLPGPTLIVNEGDVVTVVLHNALPAAPAGLPVSIVFPGMEDVTASGGSAGAVTAEVALGGAPVTYRFRAARPGTFQYHSGTRQDVEVEMGLYGAIVVRPRMGAGFAYDHPDTGYDREHLFVLSEVDPEMHDLVAQGKLAQVDTSTWKPHYWLLNGRAAPDTFSEAFAPQFPHQPYSCLPRIHPGDRLLMRVVNAGRDLHPFHHHANHARVVGVDGNLLASTPGGPLDGSWLEFTVGATPGQTVDTLFDWTGEGLGWDVYGHTSAAQPMAPFECPSGPSKCDHGKPMPVVLPDALATFYGEFHSGSPFLGKTGPRQPLGWKNNTGAFFFMWHSHTEREIVNYDAFPGGMMTMLVVEAPWVPID